MSTFKHDLKKISSYSIDKLSTIGMIPRDLTALIVNKNSKSSFDEIFKFYKDYTITLKYKNSSSMRNVDDIGICFLHKAGKGWFEKDGKVVPLFEYDYKHFRRDAIQKMTSTYRDVSINGVLDTNLVGHIVRLTSREDGGYVMHEFGDSVVIQTKSKRHKIISKKNLRIVGKYDTKSSNVVAVLQYDITYDAVDAKINKSESKRRNKKISRDRTIAVKEYSRLMSTIDDNWQMSDVAGKAAEHSATASAMQYYWDLMTTKQKKLVTKHSSTNE